MKTILKLTEKDLHNIVKESVMKILKEGRDWSDEEIEDRIDTEANMDDFPADIKSVKESVDEIGDTPQGQYMLGRLQARQQYRRGQETGENDGYGYAYGSGGKQDATCDYAHNKRQGEQYGTIGNPYHAARNAVGYSNEFARQQKLHPNKWAK